MKTLRINISQYPKNESKKKTFIHFLVLSLIISIIFFYLFYSNSYYLFQDKTVLKINVSEEYQFMF